MAQELAAAYVSIYPRLTDAGKKLAQDLSKINVDQAGEKIGTRLANKISDAVKRVDLGESLISSGEKLAKIGMAATAAGAVTVAAFKSAVEASSDFVENQNKVSVVFGENAQAIEDFGVEAYKAFGLSKNQALSMTALFGDMGKSMGIPQDELVNMSKSLAGLAADVASFKNVEVEQAQTALAGIFTGETESLKQLGVVMTETALQEYAVATGAEKEYKAMTQAEKVALRYNYVMDALADASGDYARSGDEYANVVRTFQASLENLQIVVGNIAREQLKDIIPKVTELVDKFAAAPPWVFKLVTALGAIVIAAGPVLSMFSGLIIALGQITKRSGQATAAKAIEVAVLKQEAIAANLAAGGTGKLTLAEQANLISTRAMTKAHSLAGRAMSILKVGALGAVGGFIGLAAYMAKSGTGAGDISAKIAEFSNIGIEAINKFTAALPQMLSNSDGTFQKILESIKGFLNAFIAAVPQIIQTIIPAVGQALSSFASAVAKNAPKVAEAIRGIFESDEGTKIDFSPITGGIAEAFKTIVDQIPVIAGPVIDGIVSFFSSIDWSGTFSSITGAISGLIKNIGSKASEIGGIIKEALTGLITTISQELPTLIPDIVKILTEIITTIIKALPGFINTLTDGAAKLIVSVTEGLVSVIPILADLVAKIILGIAEALPTIIETILPVVVKAIELLVNILTTTLTTVLPRIIDAIILVINKIVELLPVFIPALLSAAIQLFMALVDAIPTIIDALVTTLPQVIEAIVNILPTLIPLLLDAAIQLFMALVEALPTIIDALVEAIPKVIDAIIQILPTLIPVLLDAAVKLFMALVEALIKIGETLLEELPKIWDKLIGKMSEAGSMLFNAAKDLFEQIVSGLRDKAVEAVNAMGKLISDLISAIQNAVGDFVQAGMDLILGIANGIADGAKNALDSIGNFCGDALSTVTGFFGIHSPSTVMAGIGRNIMQGMANGISRATGLATRAMSVAAEGILDEASPIAEVASSFDSAISGTNATVASGTASAGDNEILRWLNSTLGDVIESRTPTISTRDFGRQVRAVVN